jgi:O-antigen/teichoic acid export membrane protein
MVLFILLVLSFTLSRIVFYVFLAARRMVFGLYKQTVQSGLGVILLLALHPLLPGYVAAITAYTLALLISLLLAFSFFPQVQPGYRFSLAFKEINVSSFTGYSFANYLLEQIQTIPTTLLPILVLNILGPSFGAYFSIPWSIGLGMVSLAGSVSETLFSEGAYDPTNAAANVRKSARFGFLVTLGMAACAITSGRLMLYIYGPQYAENGAWLLYLVSLALLPDVLIMIFVSYLRIQDRLNVVLIITSVNAALGIGLGVAGMLRFGLTGAGAGWLASRVLVVGLVYFLKGAPRITPVPRAG